MIINICDLKVDESKLKEMDKFHFEKLKSSIQNYGQLRNILIDDNSSVVEGRKILAAMQELGYKQIEVRVIAGFNFLCRLALDCEYSAFDFVETSAELSKTFNIEDKKMLYGVLPFTNTDIDDYIESTKFSFDNYDKKDIIADKSANLFDIMGNGG